MKQVFSFVIVMLMTVTINAQVKPVKQAAPKVKETTQESITLSQFERAVESDFLIDKKQSLPCCFSGESCNW